MPQITFPSKWLKAEVNVQHGDFIRFLDKGVLKDDQWVFTVGVIPQETPGFIKEQKYFGLNKKNFDAIKKVYGSNSDNWLNKEMQVDIRMIENPKTGEEVAAVRLKAPGSLAEGRTDDDDQEYNGQFD
jgi:plasmid maintenance system antidote protein VapI